MCKLCSGDYSDGYDSGYEAGVEDGKAEAKREADEKIRDLETEVSNLRNAIGDAKDKAHEIWYDLGNA